MYNDFFMIANSVFYALNVDDNKLLNVNTPRGSSAGVYVRVLSAHMLSSETALTSTPTRSTASGSKNQRPSWHQITL